MDREYLKKLSQDQLIEMCLKKDESERKCRQELKWIHQLMSNTTASGDEKEAAYWVRFRMKGTEPREDGLFHVYNADVVKQSGLSEDKLGKVLKKFGERKIIKRKLERKPDKATGQLKTESWLAFDQDFLENPRTVDFGKNTNHGGTREKGKANSCGCGCADKVIDRRVTCAGCGAVLDETRKIVKADDDQDLDEEVF